MVIMGNDYWNSPDGKYFDNEIKTSEENETSFIDNLILTDEEINEILSDILKKEN
jgi:hypothetical protein